MATTKKAAPAKKGQGFQGVKGAFWIIAVCFVLAVCFFKYFLGNADHINPANGEVIDGNMWGTIYKGGVVVPVILTLLFSVIALSIERGLALNTAFGKGKLPKFVANIKAALNANDFVKAQELCDKQRGSVANVVGASLRAYKEMEAVSGIKKAQKVAKIQQAHEEATQLEMPTLTMNMPIIATIVTLGTLTALFGTVVGMIRSFAALAAGGGADSQALSLGISEALVNTASGILTSWVAVVAYNYYTNKIDKLTFALDEVGYSIAQTYEANHTEEA
ncbi:flagellar motor protein MotA [Prevotella sp. P3-120]|uniref:MotA/TolQ/ExbB proton channel family protein n=1 Tax=Xylanibacter brevis TaxID=83231 RepID=A0ABS9CDC2_9BACT|nr:MULTISPECIES: MotA/TolQ/ExbB proton channel family protein [Prevotellaceae]MBS7319465.1 MotA/TolQ/ExbB proton channel family protein [Prevotella sp.]MCF2560741.1 MotA/TolQ/ExbB proton channel family protein [Xylanibacter brevis]MCF2563094.1 MotA/TolQ/ExbB proton channel family protein [Xylanibacter brevis]MCI7001504.1 MotA/TolQ/ExbB proton channel family protein [Prevotella sp.]MDD7172730.1 MotA/TolQ/ExbB proton channel family protein [Prevotella sp.]